MKCRRAFQLLKDILILLWINVEVQETDTWTEVCHISKIKSLLFMIITVGLAFALILFPKYALTASLRGLNLWWEIVFPSLLPFFITAELLIGLGVVHGLGAFSERFMRPLFNVPGSGGFVWVMGMASGYPAGARWTADLRKKGQVTKAEAERLVSFTNASSPLFIFGAVAVGFFHSASLGLLIAIAHYVSNALVGVGMRFYKRKEPGSEYRVSATWKDAFLTMHKSRLEDGRPIGKLMGDAVTQSVDTLLMVGGFIMLFSVLTELFRQSGILALLSRLLVVTDIPGSFHIPLFAGLLEMTTGINGVSDTSEPLLAQLMMVSFMLGFHGLSIQAQIASILSETDIDFKPYAFARLAHASLAAILTYLLFPYFSPPISESPLLPIWSQNDSITLPFFNLFHDYGPPITIMMILTMVIIKYVRNRPNKNSRYEHLS